MSFRFDDSGFKKLEKQLDSASGEHQYSLGELFTEEFMAKHTPYATFDAFVEAAGIHSTEEFEATPDDIFDEHVAKNTKFDSWGDMLAFAFTAKNIPLLVED